MARLAPGWPASRRHIGRDHRRMSRRSFATPDTAGASFPASRLQAVHLNVSVIEHRQAAVAVELAKALRHVVERRIELQLALAKFRLGGVAGRDVLVGGDPASL